MNYLSAEGLGKSYHEQWLFRDLSVGIGQGERLALVGPNGVGKSTLLRILAGEIEPDEGAVALRDGIRKAFLVQQPQVPDNVLVSDLLFSGQDEKAKTIREYEHCLQHPDDVSEERMSKVLEKMEELQAWDYEARAREITTNLGIGDMDVTFGSLSGGQRKRVFLAQVLLSDPDLIILDEPTNHLDLEAIEWLERELSGSKVTFLMVTHDRYFLDRVANGILEMDRGKLYRHAGNYAYYLEKKSEREEMLRTEVTKARNLMRKELDWIRRQPKARGTKAKYRVDAFEDLKVKASQQLRRDKLELDVQEARQGGKILEFHEVSASWGERKMVDRFSYVFKKADRIGIVGPNGVGKSTFLNLLTGKLQPKSGEIIPGVTTRIGYFTQEAADLDPEKRPIDEVKEIAEFITLSDGSQVSASRFLEQFLFPAEKQYTRIAKLSGGEKKRLQLLKVLVRNPNFLVLDEPTNDFDIDTLNVLEEFLEQFAGCLVLVSHDRYFMDRLVEQLFVFEGDGRVRIFAGNYSDFRERQEEEEEVEAVKPSSVAAAAEPVVEQTENKRKLSFAERREHESLQQEIPGLEQDLRNATAEMSSGSTGHERLAELGAKIQTLQAEIEGKTERWLELEERMQAANG